MSVKITKVDWIGDREENVGHRHLVAQIKAFTEQKMLKIATDGIPDNWHERLQEFGDVLCERGDILLYPTKKTLDEATRIAEGLTDAIAILAFVKGGVECFGWHFEGIVNGSGKT